MSLVDFHNLGLDAAVVQELERLSLSIFFYGYSGKGANGETFFGANLVVRRRVAVKFYYCGEGSRFHAEPQYLAAVKSPHIIEVLDANVVGGEWAVFQMPFCERGDLDDYLSAGHPSLHHGLDLAIGLASGVATLHSSGLLHRDLKPGNLLITEHSCLVIGDFGSVHRLAPGEAGVAASGHTILYRPPEGFGGAHYAAVSDIYQCGVILYQIMGGHLPYEADAWIDRVAKKCIEATDDPVEQSRCVDDSIRRKIQGSRLLDPSTLPPTVPDSVRRVINKATRADPSDRYQTCAELIAKLNDARAGHLDWRAGNGQYRAYSNDREVRIVPCQHGHRAEQNGGAGWRRIGAVGEGPAREIIKRVEARLSR